MGGFKITLLLAAATLVGCLASSIDREPGDGELESRYRRAARLRGSALAAMDASDCTAAVPDLEEIEHLLPDNLFGPLNLAVCYFRLGDDDRALAAASRARAIAPTNPRLLFALARIYHQASEEEAWRETLESFREAHPRDPRPHFLSLEALIENGSYREAHAAAESALRFAPENLVLLLARLTTAARAGLGEATIDALDAVEDRLGGFDDTLEDYAATIRADAASTAGAVPRALVVENILRPTELYRLHLVPLTGGDRERGLFAQLDFDPALPKSIQGGQDIEVTFTPAASDGLVGDALRVVSSADRDRLLVARRGSSALLEASTEGWMGTRSPAPGPADRLLAMRDFDQDGATDHLWARGAELVLAASTVSRPITVGDFDDPIPFVVPADLDQEGDLDLLVPQSSGTRYLQNDGDGSWTERPRRIGPLGDLALAAAAIADLDDDGDLDIVAATAEGVVLLANRLADRLVDVTEAWGLGATSTGWTGVAIEDFDGDGRFDLLLWGGGPAALWGNIGGRFEARPLPPTRIWRAALTADYDNDGDRDVVASTDEGLVLLRNRRDRFEQREPALEAAAVDDLFAGDFDGDGDLDLVAWRDGGGSGFWRNEGGDLNHWLRIRLRGKHDNNSKNNTEGLFVRIEVRVGGEVQTVLGNGGYNHLGLGSARQADAVRVVWTNGLAQSWAALAADQSLDETQVLKGSCPFLYTWNGDRFEFVTDLMWKSPLGMTMADGSAAPHQSARDFVHVPSRALAAVDGEFWLQVTEELWEVAYVDLQRLLVVDHPSSVAFALDERLTMPPHPKEPPIRWARASVGPRRAVDQLGRDVLAEISRTDGEYVGDLPLDRYQGITRGHALELEFELPRAARAGELELVLEGWIFPTDSSINYALAQDRSRQPEPPSVEAFVDGAWRIVGDAVAIPAGKRKTVVVALDQLDALAAERTLRLRLRTNMQIYWDAASLRWRTEPSEIRLTRLAPIGAELHYRGFSALETRLPDSPHLFDYDRVDTEARFADLAGFYTRFGDVTPLLASRDDRYVVMNAGDEMTVRYPASLPPLPSGWRRHYVLETDGWVKDGDLHTAASRTVRPLPSLEMSRYPDPALAAHTDSTATADPDTLRTRWVDDAQFRRALATGRSPR